MRPVTGNRKVARFPGNYLPFVCKNAERRPPILLPALTIAAYRYRWKVACFSSPRRLPAHVIREEKAASGSSLSRATGRRYSHSMEMFAFGMKMDEQSGAFDQDVLASPVWALARIGTFMRW
ncbi:hypothetical protein VNO78_36376 [Psophocarpus tetragonolobus]|uniref:Uncharacterized protein n=1 Tax=Psophocarpus tetragonolobus TaxID=3891 RepID=A0AAN9NEF4_PSOTE